MSLNPQQRRNTIDEFEANLARSGQTVDEIAAALHTTPEAIDDIMALRVNHVESPWILKNYLLKTLAEQGIEPVPFSALAGDYHQYWFLDADRIDRNIITD